MSSDGRTAETLLENQEEIENLAESIEEYVSENSGERRYFSTDVISLGKHDVTLDIYGVPGYPMPEKRTVVEAVGEFYGWETPGMEEFASEEDYYSIRVLDWDSI